MMIYLAWIRNDGGVPVAQIWRDLESCEPYYSESPPRGMLHDQFIAKFALKPEETSLSIDELKKLYPCPK
jgi:hypothetical protein